MHGSGMPTNIRVGLNLGLEELRSQISATQESRLNGLSDGPS